MMNVMRKTLSMNKMDVNCLANELWWNFPVENVSIYNLLNFTIQIKLKVPVTLIMVIEVVVAMVDADLDEAVVMEEEAAAVLVVEGSVVAEVEEVLVDTVVADRRKF